MRYLENPMNRSQQKIIISQAVELLEKHFEFLNQDKILLARDQLFNPGEPLNPIETYLEKMCSLRPFEIISISLIRFEDVRKKRHGNVATIWLDTKVRCVAGENSADIIIWWFPNNDQYKIAARPSHWLLDSSQIRAESRE